MSAMEAFGKGSLRKAEGDSIRGSLHGAPQRFHQVRDPLCGCCRKVEGWEESVGDSGENVTLEAVVLIFCCVLSSLTSERCQDKKSLKSLAKFRLPGHQNDLGPRSHLIDGNHCTLHHMVLFLTRYSYIHMSSIRYVAIFPHRSAMLGD
jgi:hypothetical protein